MSEPERRPRPIPYCVGRITLSGSPPYARSWTLRTGAADGPHPCPARRLADVKDNRDATVHHGPTTGRGPGVGRDEQGEVTA